MKYLKFAILTFLIASSLSVASSMVMAQEGVSTATIVLASDGSTSVQGDFDSGLTTVTYENQSDTLALQMIALLDEGATEDEFMAAAREGQERAQELATLYGGPGVYPQQTVTVTYDLQPGIYLTANFGVEEMPQFTFFEVTGQENDAMAEFEADATVELHDFAYTAPVEVEAGEQIWRIENQGTQEHEMLISQIENDMTVEEFQDYISSNIDSFNPLDANLRNASWGPIAPGQYAWLTLDLAPGTYVIHCYIPALPGDGQPHAAHGMVQLITVTE